MEVSQLRKLFKEHFAQEPLLVRAPGRINIIGEHTDYNDGFVLPAAIDKEIRFAIALNHERIVNVHALNNDQNVSFSVNELSHSALSWPDFFMGVIEVLQEEGVDVPGFNCMFWGDIPIGAGMSSSAALESGVLFALNELLGLSLNSKQMALLGQRAENQFVGVQCGIMDQFASIHGKKGQVFRLDCRDLSYAYFPFSMADHRIVLCNSLVSHSLAESEYNVRRSQCEAGVSILNEQYGGILKLRDVSLSQLSSSKALIDPVVYRRCEFVIEENDRVARACMALSQGDLKGLGQLVNESHHGLQHQYEVSCPELDFLAEKARNMEGVLGSRMMGGGFGGCTLNIVEKDQVDRFTSAISSDFYQAYQQDLPVYVMKLVKGVGLIK